MEIGDGHLKHREFYSFKTLSNLLFISQEEIDGYEDFEEHLMGPP
jgi:hypothetical protein